MGEIWSDFANFGSGIAGLASGAASVGNVVSNVFNGIQQRQIADQNLQFQKDTNAQNVGLMRESWAREDNATQRRAADLKAAGINPLLAAGSPAQASPAVRVSAPQRSETTGLEGIGNALIESVRAFAQISQTQAQTDLTRAQTQNAGTTGALLSQDVEFNKFANPIKLNQLESNLKGIDLTNVGTDISNAAKKVGIAIDTASYAEKLYKFYGNNSGGNQVMPGGTNITVMKNSPLSIELQASALALASENKKYEILIELSKTNPGLAEGLAQWFGIITGGGNTLSKFIK